MGIQLTETEWHLGERRYKSTPLQSGDRIELTPHNKIGKGIETFRASNIPVTIFVGTEDTIRVEWSGVVGESDSFVNLYTGEEINQALLSVNHQSGKRLSVSFVPEE